MVKDLDTQLQDYLHKVKKLVPSIAQRAEMTAVGGKVLETNLKEETRKKHYQPERDTSKMKHLADSITTVNTDMNDLANGNSIVGFETASESGINHARIARFLNDGTKKMQGDNFHTETVRNSETEVFSAIKEKYKGITGGGI